MTGQERLQLERAKRPEFRCLRPALAWWPRPSLTRKRSADRHDCKRHDAPAWQGYANTQVRETNARSPPRAAIQRFNFAVAQVVHLRRCRRLMLRSLERAQHLIASGSLFAFFSAQPRRSEAALWSAAYPQRIFENILSAREWGYSQLGLLRRQRINCTFSQLMKLRPC